jgi:hypothetical protein
MRFPPWVPTSLPIHSCFAVAKYARHACRELGQLKALGEDISELIRCQCVYTDEADFAHEVIQSILNDFVREVF